MQSISNFSDIQHYNPTTKKFEAVGNIGNLATVVPTDENPISINLRVSNWDQEIVDQDNNMLLLPCEGFSGKQLKDVVNDAKVPLILFTNTCWQEIQYITNKYPNQEWAVFVTMKRASELMPHFIAFDWFMPPQDVSGGSVSVDAAGSQPYYDYLKENYPYYKENGLHKFLCHLHSHHSMHLANFSSIDDAQQFGRDDLGFYDDYRFYIVVTTSTVKASLVVYNPVAIRIDAAVGIAFNRPEYAQPLTKTRKKEIDEICNSRVKSTVRTYIGNTQPAWRQGYNMWDSIGGYSGYDTQPTKAERWFTSPFESNDTAHYEKYAANNSAVPILSTTIERFANIIKQMYGFEAISYYVAQEESDGIKELKKHIQIQLADVPSYECAIDTLLEQFDTSEIPQFILPVLKALQDGESVAELLEDELCLSDEDTLRIVANSKITDTEKANQLKLLWQIN